MSPDSPFPLPDPVSVAAPPPLFWGLLLLTFLLHLIAMNLLVGGSILALVSRLGRSLSSRERRQWVSSNVISSLPTLMAATVTLGVAPLLFVQVLYGRTFYSSSIVLGWRWLAVVFLLIAAYSLFYRLAFRSRRESNGKDLRGNWMLALSSLLLLLVAFLYVNNMSLMLRPEAILAKYQAGAHWNLDDWTLLPRYFHMMTGALAVTGLALALWAIELEKPSNPASESVSRYGAGIFIGATAFNFVIGTIFLLTLPRPVLIQVISGNLISAMSLVSAILFALVALGCALLALATPYRRMLLWVTAVCLTATLISMILFRDQVRSIFLEELSSPLWIESQWGVITLFFVLFTAGLGTLGLMAYWWRNAGRERTS